MPPIGELAAAVLRGIVLAVGLITAGPAAAGPPFRTDDPVPVEPDHWEIYAFSTATHVQGDAAGTAAGIDANYGAAPELQLHAAVPLNFAGPSGAAPRIGVGDTEIGFKYRLIAEDEQGWQPQAAIYPVVDFPTGNAARNLGTGHAHAFLPVWVQKTWDPWATFAGVGYWLNPGMGNRNYWYVGWAVQHQVTDNLAIGGELFHQTADTVGGRDQTGFDLGATYDLSEHYHLLLSIGQGVQQRNATNQFSYYLALQLTF